MDVSLKDLILDRIPDYLSRPSNKVKALHQSISIYISQCLPSIKNIFRYNRNISSQAAIKKINLLGNYIKQLQYQINHLQDNISSIHKQRDQINDNIISKENRLNCIKQGMRTQRISNFLNQLFEELVDSIKKFNEKCVYLKQKNQDFKKILIHQRKKITSQNNNIKLLEIDIIKI